MGLCFSACACCCGKMTKCCCFAGKTEVGSKLFYLLTMFIVIVLAVALRLAGGDIFSGMYSFDACPTAPESAVDRCVGIQSVYRVSFALFLFFIVMSIFTRAARGFHTGFWICKVPLLLLLLIGSFFIPNDVFDVYQEVSRVGSVLFILLQVLILIDFAYDLHDCMLSKAAAYDEQLEKDGYEANLCGNCWRVGYVLLCMIIILLGFGGAASMYIVLPACGLNTFFISQCIVIGLVCIVISVTEKVGKGLLPPAILLAHSVFLTWGAIRSNPDTECNDAATDSSFQGVALGVVIAACSLTWTSFRMGASAYNVFRCGGGDDDDAAALDDDDEAEAARQERLEAALTERKAAAADDGDSDEDKPKKRKAFGSKDDEDDEETPDDQVHWPFHIVMALGALYLAMLLTNWGTTETTDLTAATDLSSISMWVKMISQWLSVIIYLWTLCAPLACKGRDFRDPHNSFGTPARR